MDLKFLIFKEIKMKAKQLLGLAISGVLLSGAVFAGQSVTAYTTFDQEDARQTFKLFTEETGIEVNWVRLSTGEAVARMEAEKANPQASIWFGGVGVGHIQAKNKGLTRSYFSPAAANIPSNFKDKDGFWTGIYAGTLGFISNTKNLKRFNLDAPTSWEDLLDPKYRGHIRMANPGSSGTAYNILGTFIQIYGEDKGFELIGELDKNISLYTRSGSAPLKQAALGEVTVGISYTATAVKMIGEGYPIVVTRPTEGTGYETAAISLIKGGPADEQAAAEALLDWGLGKVAGAFYATRYVSPFVDVPLPEGAVPLSAVNTVVQDDEWSAANKNRLLDKWNDVVGGGVKTVTNKGDLEPGLAKKE
jgi:iron(III) transport system substrate-binding protein